MVSRSRKNKEDDMIYDIDQADITEEEIVSKESEKEQEEVKEEETPNPKEEKPQPKPKKKKRLTHIDTYLQVAQQLYKISPAQMAGFKAHMNGNHYSYDEKSFDIELKKYLNIK